MSSRERTHEASQLLLGFAARTGLDTSPGAGASRERCARRYLWTDAFALSGLLALWRETGERRYTDLALRLIDVVHHVLGKHRPDGPRAGWLSGLGDEQGEAHPTLGGLRIGKRAPERGSGEAYDEAAEWDRDGQYFHYLTRWMHALDQTARHTRQARFNLWARELAKVAHRAFVQPGPGAPQGMYWKMSTDLSRPLVTAMGQHDPLDGLVTCTELQTTAALFPPQTGPGLAQAVRDFSSLLRGRDLVTGDPLGLGGLLIDARRVLDMMKLGAFSDGSLLDRLLDAVERGLGAYALQVTQARPATQRLAFRELGLAIGLGALEVMLRDAGSVLEERAHAARLRARIVALARRRALGSAIESFWLEPQHRRVEAWRAHQDINDVMLASSLLPDVAGLP